VLSQISLFPHRFSEIAGTDHHTVSPRDGTLSTLSLRKEAGPIATRFVREKTGETTTRDDNEKAEYLPPSLSKRQCFYQYCLSRGAKVTANNQGCMLVEDIEGLTRLPPIPSWFAYRNFWVTEYPDLCVSRPTEDICSYCYKFQNTFRYTKKVVDDDVIVNEVLSDDDEDSPPTVEKSHISSSPLPPRPGVPLPALLGVLTTVDDETSDEEDGEHGEVVVLEEEAPEVEAPTEVEAPEEEDVDEDVLQRGRSRSKMQ
jgi:hypothetical protein